MPLQWQQGNQEMMVSLLYFSLLMIQLLLYCFRIRSWGIPLQTLSSIKSLLRDILLFNRKILSEHQLRFPNNFSKHNNQFKRTDIMKLPHTTWRHGSTPSPRLVTRLRQPPPTLLNFSNF